MRIVKWEMVYKVYKIIWGTQKVFNKYMLLGSFGDFVNILKHIVFSPPIPVHLGPFWDGTCDSINSEPNEVGDFVTMWRNHVRKCGLYRGCQCCEGSLGGENKETQWRPEAREGISKEVCFNMFIVFELVKIQNIIILEKSTY